MVLGNLEDDQLGSVTNRFEEAAMEVAARYLGPRALTAKFYDHWSGGPDDESAFAAAAAGVARREVDLPQVPTGRPATRSRTPGPSGRRPRRPGRRSMPPGLE